MQEISWHVLRGVSLSSVLGRISVELLVQQVSVPPHWQPVSSCILVRLCTQLQHIYVYHGTDYGIKRIGGCCPSELSHVSGAEYNIQATAYHQHTYNADGKCSRQHVRLCRQQENICLQYSTDFDMKRIGA